MGLGPQENISESGDYEIHMYDQLIRRIELWYKTRAQIAPELKELEHELVVLEPFFSPMDRGGWSFCAGMFMVAM